MREADHSEQETLAGAIAGDEAACEELVRTHLSGVQAVARALTANPDEADDVVQEAFIKAQECISGLRPPYRFGPWVKQIARNIARNRCIRRFQGEVPYEEAIHSQSQSEIQGCSDVGGHEEDDDRIGRALRLLSSQSPILRETARLRYLSNKSVSEIARRLEVPAGSIKRRLWQARENIRKEMTRAMDGTEDTKNNNHYIAPTIEIEELSGVSMQVPVRGDDRGLPRGCTPRCNCNAE
ncbi:MAG: sigma-70 family RNA polymerase sigma factor [Candidatus Coatesbacteria bacterium]|nr:sigma-70 family RNA polymerase sigma factor [Candidatus Coatesbacteria bacterium]